MERRKRLMRRDTLAGLERQHEDKDALSNWRSPTRPGREIDGSKETVELAEPGSRWKGERVAEGPVVARKRRNGRGAKRPCCLAMTPTKRKARVNDKGAR
jgi:hypothetical protein